VLAWLPLLSLAAAASGLRIVPPVLAAAAVRCFAVRM
jgi:hypothetical protein